MSASTILICIAAFSAAVLIASWVIAKIESAPNAVDDECSRVDDAVGKKAAERTQRMAAYPSPF